MIIKCPITGNKYERFDYNAYHNDDCPFCNPRNKIIPKILFLSLYFFLSIFIINFVSASAPINDTIFNTTISNSSITFDSIIINVEGYVIENNSISLYNASFINSNSHGNLTINITGNSIIFWNDTNKDIKSNKFMYLTSASNKEYIITSDLTVTTTGVSATVENIYSCPKISSINYKRASSATATSLLATGLYTCSGTTLKLEITNVDYGNNTISISYTEPSTGGGSSLEPTPQQQTIIDEVDKQYNRTYICEQVKYFNNIYKGNQTESEYLTFKSNLVLAMGKAISDDILKEFIKNYNVMCADVIPTTNNNNQNPPGTNPNTFNYIPLIIFVGVIILLVLIILVVRINQTPKRVILEDM